jgi:hypothetical protein
MQPRDERLRCDFLADKTNSHAAIVDRLPRGGFPQELLAFDSLESDSSLASIALDIGRQGRLTR